MEQKIKALEIKHCWTKEIPTIYSISRQGKLMYLISTKLNKTQG